MNRLNKTESVVSNISGIMTDTFAKYMTNNVEHSFRTFCSHTTFQEMEMIDTVTPKIYPRVNVM